MTGNLARPWLRGLVAITVLGMVLVNALANILPINGRQTGQVSDAYGNLFAPAGITFAIWGVIYFLLGAHVVYQLGLVNDPGTRSPGLLARVGMLFAASSLVNTAWIFAWHYEVIWLSAVLLIAMLVLLILITLTIRGATLTRREELFVRLPFSVYFGWITVATVANITVWLVSIDWSGFGLPDQIWAVLIITVAAAIGTVTMLRNHDVAYGLVLIWAFSGILIKHTSQTGFGGQYPAVIATTVACLAVFVAAAAVILLRRGQAVRS